MLLTGMVYGQEQSFSPTKKNEFKLNSAYLIAGIAEGSYEFILNEESAVGLTLGVAFEDDISFRYNITPYYRFYFGKKLAAGFFAEAFSMINEQRDDGGFINISGQPAEVEFQTAFALGFAIGGKFITKNGFSAEIYGGVGRNFGNNDLFETVPRFGLNIGKRF